MLRMNVAHLQVNASLPQLRIVGDIAVRAYNGASAAAVSALNAATGAMPTVANLEGPVAERSLREPRSGVWSASAPLSRVADDLRLVALSLANNHIHDLGGDLRTTHLWASRHSRGVLGLEGPEVSPALMIQDNEDRAWVFVGCGWQGSGCRHRLRGQPWQMLSPLDREFDALLVSLRHRWPDALLVVLPHWNYEFEIHPQPVFRSCSRRWAALGVDCIAGAHPHVIGGYEAFGSTPVAYSLGNAVFDRRQYFGGALRPRSEEDRLGALVLSHATRTAELFSAPIQGQSVRLAGTSLSGWGNYDDAVCGPYDLWYRANRRHRRRGLPVFGEYDRPQLVAAKETLVRKRAWAVSSAHSLLRRRS